MILEITTYQLADSVSDQQITEASQRFDQNYCQRCEGLLRRDFVKTENGYMDLFYWRSAADAERVKAGFLQDGDAMAYAQLLDPQSLTMQNFEVLSSFVTR